MLKGLLLTAKADPGLLARETLRRLLGVGYKYNGVNVKNAHTFRVLRDAILRGYKLWKCGNLYCLDTGWGVLKASSPELFALVVREDFDAMYGALDYQDAVALDVGGYIGDTALWMLARGARFVHVYEPVYWREATQNLEGKPAAVYPYAVWWGRRKLKISLEGPGTGSHSGDVEVETVPITDVLKAHNPDIVKLDCEGCEWTLLQLDCELLRQFKWLIEVHGPEIPLMEKLQDCGLVPKIVTRLSPWVSVLSA